MQYRIKLKRKLIINRKAGQTIRLGKADCRLLKSAATSDMLFISSDDDLSRPLSLLAKAGPLDVLALDRNHNLLNIHAAKGAEVRIAAEDGILKDPNGACADDVGIIQLSWYFHLLKCSEVYS